jgi:ParB-like chromosome segregation protein Spo0J
MASRVSSSVQAATLKNSVLTDLRKAQAAIIKADEDRAQAAERRAEAVRTLLNDFGMTHADLAKVLGLSVAAVGKIRDS